MIGTTLVAFTTGWYCCMLFMLFMDGRKRAREKPKPISKYDRWGE